MQAITHCVLDKPIRRKLEEVLFIIVKNDFPHNWNDMLKKITCNMQSASKVLDIYGSLLALKTVLACLEMKTKDGQQSIHLVQKNLFPWIESVA